MSIRPLSQPGASARKPSTPTSVSASANPDGTATVSFTPSENPGKPSGNYVVTSSPGSITATGATSPIVVSGLSLGTSYTFTVVKQSGTGISSDTSAPSGSGTAFTIPGAPVISAARTASQTIGITLTTAAADNGSTVTSYEYRIKAGAGSYGSYATLSGTTGPWSISGLTNGTTYTVQVRAVNAAGAGPGSNEPTATPYEVPIFGTQTGTSAATPPSGGSTTGISNVYTTTGTLSKSIGAGATFYDYERMSGTGGGVSGDSLSGLAENTDHEWRVRVTNTSSTFALTTRVTPNGSTTTVAVEYGNSGSYGTSAGSVNIGAGITEVASSWNLGSSGSATVYWRATATYAGGATVQTTGTISRNVVISNGTSTGVFRTYTTRSASGPASVSKPSYGANILISSYTLVGGGGGGGDRAGAFLGYGGGGGGNVQTGGSISTSSFTLSSPGAGGNRETAGTASTLSYPGTTVTAAGGNGASGNLQGGSSGNGNAGHAGASGYIGGGGGGVSGAASDINGGSGNGSQGPGGPGHFNNGFGGVGNGVYINGSAASAGAGGMSNSSGTNGTTSITWVGPA